MNKVRQRFLPLLALLSIAAMTSDRSSAAPPDIVITVAASSAADRLERPVARTVPARPAPVATVQQALALARRLRRQASPDTAISIELAPGIHRITTPILIGPDDSGVAGRPLVIRGRGKATIRGSVRLLPERVRPLSVLNGLPEATRADVRVYTLPAALAGHDSIGRPRFHPIHSAPLPFEVFDAAGAMRPARWPNSGWARIESVGPDNKSFNLQVASARAMAWSHEPELWAAGYWGNDWSYETQRVARFEPGAMALTLTDLPPYGVAGSARVAVFHARSELDEPGEWYRDAKQNTLLAWPRPGDPTRAVEISVAPSAFLFDGARHVRIEHLTIEMTRGDGVVVRGGDDIVLDHVALRWTGGRAATFEDSRDSGVRFATVRDTGEGGVLLSGGDRRELRPARLFVEDSDIDRFARLGRTYKAAIELRGVGNRANDNVIKGGPHLAILFQGNDHLIEANDISDVATETSDSGAIYTGRDWTARGTVIRHNVLHDLRAAAGMEIKGVYLDDMASGITIERNVFLRVDQPVFIGGGRDNRVHNNVFVASEPAIHIDGRGLDWAKASVLDPGGELRSRLAAMPIQSPIWRSRYPELATLLDQQPASARGNSARGNIVVGGARYRLFSEVSRDAQRLEEAPGPDWPDDVARRAALVPSATALQAVLGPVLAGAGQQWPLNGVTRAGRVLPPPQGPGLAR